ncbi:MAG TPA: EamA family transporter [Xanthobacteraceae bacterium]|nr:EamA family transporter [Xanthobacteraceae bacterium]
MRARDMALAVLVSVIWGFSYVTYRFGLESFSAAQLSAARFLLACVAIAFVPRPKVSWAVMLVIGLVMFAGQFLLLMLAYTLDMPAGLGSVTQQTQAVFTIAFAAIFMREFPTLRQGIGMAVAMAGLVLIGFTIGGDLKPAALALALAAATSWAIGNIVVKSVRHAPAFALMAWCSPIAVVPLLAYSWAFDPQPSFLQALAHASWLSLAVVAYLAIASTLVGYAMWGHLLQRHPASVVAPFALLSPATGILASALILGEQFSPLRVAGMALIMLGLAIIVMPVPSLVARMKARSAAMRDR